MALIPHAYPPCHDCQCVFPCVLFSFTRCLNSCRGNRKPGSEEGAFSHPQRNVDLSTPIPSTYACSRPYSRPLCYAYSLEHIGATEWLPEALMDNGASLCAATPALFATLIEAIATSDGAVAIDTYGGTLENHALRMAAYAARGTADLLLAGQQPEEIRKEVATEGGATRQGLNALDRMKVAEALRKFMTEIFAAAGTLGERN